MGSPHDWSAGSSGRRLHEAEAGASAAQLNILQTAVFTLPHHSVWVEFIVKPHG